MSSVDFKDQYYSSIIRMRQTKNLSPNSLLVNQLIKNDESGRCDLRVTLAGYVIQQILLSRNGVQYMKLLFSCSYDRNIKINLISLDIFSFQFIKDELYGLMNFIQFIQESDCQMFGFLDQESTIFKLNKSDIEGVDSTIVQMVSQYKAIKANLQLDTPYQLNYCNIFQEESYSYIVKNGITLFCLRSNQLNQTFDNLTGYITFIKQQQTNKSGKYAISMRITEGDTQYGKQQRYQLGIPYVDRYDLDVICEQNNYGVFKIGQKILIKKIFVLLGKPGLYFKTFYEKIVIQNLFEDLGESFNRQVKNMNLQFVKDIPKQSLYRKTVKLVVDPIKLIKFKAFYRCLQCQNVLVQFVDPEKLFCQTCNKSQHINNLNFEIFSLILAQDISSKCILKLSQDQVVQFFQLTSGHLKAIKSYIQKSSDKYDPYNFQDSLSSYLIDYFQSTTIIAIPYCDYKHTQQIKRQYQRFIKTKNQGEQAQLENEVKEQQDDMEWIQGHFPEQLRLNMNGSFEINQEKLKVFVIHQFKLRQKKQPAQKQYPS